jgi:hypothetical protein
MPSSAPKRRRTQALQGINTKGVYSGDEDGALQKGKSVKKKEGEAVEESLTARIQELECEVVPTPTSLLS